MTQKQIIKRKSIIYLLHLAISDFMFIFLTELPNSLIKLKIFDYNIFKISDVSCFCYDFCPTIFHFYSIAITVLVTADRFIAIYKPLKLNHSILNMRPNHICAMSFMISIVIALPHGLLMVYNKIEKDCDAR